MRSMILACMMLACLDNMSHAQEGSFFAFDLTFLDPHQIDDQSPTSFRWDGIVTDEASNFGTVTSPGGTQGVAEFETFEAFQADILGEWTVVDSIGNTLFFSIDSLELSDIPDRLIAPTQDATFLSGEVVAAEIVEDGDLFDWDIFSSSFPDGEIEFISTSEAIFTLDDGLQVGDATLGVRTTEFYFIKGISGDVDAFSGIEGYQTVSTPLNLTIQSVPGLNFLVTQGLYASGGSSSLVKSDDVDLSARRSNTDIQSRVYVEVTSSSTLAAPSSISFKVEASVFARRTVNQFVDVFNYATGQFVQVDFRQASRFTDGTVDVSLNGNMADYVETGTNLVKARIRFESVNQRQVFSANIDQTIWTIKE